MKSGKSKGSVIATVIFLGISGFLVTVLGSRQVYRAVTDPAWVASTDLKAGDVIRPEYLKLARSRNAEGSVNDPRALVGQQLKVAKPKGAVFSRNELDAPPKDWLAQRVPEGRVVYTLTPRKTTIPHTQLRFGDRLDILAKGAHGVRMVAQDVLLVGVLDSGSKQGSSASKGRGLVTALTQLPDTKSGKTSAGTPMVLAVAPGQVYPLAGIGEEEEVTLVLHGESEVMQGQLLEVKPIVTHRKVEIVNGLERSSVLVQY